MMIAVLWGHASNKIRVFYGSDEARSDLKI